MLSTKSQTFLYIHILCKNRYFYLKKNLLHFFDLIISDKTEDMGRKRNYRIAYRSFLIGIRPCFGFLRESPRSDRRSGRRNPSAGIGPAGGGVRRQGGAGLAVCGLPSGRRGRKGAENGFPVRAVSAQAGESVSFRRGESTALRIAARDARETAVLVDERLLSAARALSLDLVPSTIYCFSAFAPRRSSTC